jgi:hypothetical protein
MMKFILKKMGETLQIRSVGGFFWKPFLIYRESVEAGKHEIADGQSGQIHKFSPKSPLKNGKFIKLILWESGFLVN